MTALEQRLREITLKIKRAKEHVTDLERQVRVFLATNPYKIGTKHDPQTRQLIYYVTSVAHTPDCLPLIAGDVIQNLMSGLDHLAYQLVLSDTGGNPPKPTRIYFPIADNAREYEIIKHRKIEGTRKETLDAIDALSNHTKEGMTSSGCSTD